jgi:hypothetical protein
MSIDNKKPKLLTEYSVEELLGLMGSSSEKINEEQPQSDEDKLQNIVIKFLVYYDIKPGRYTINARTLYKLFRSWNKDHDMTYPEFFRNLFHQFPKKHKIINYKLYDHIKINKSLSTIVTHLEEKPKKKINTTKGKNQLRYMEEFLSIHNIKEGSVYIESDILYYLFDYYNHKKKRKPINFIAFVSMCHLYFKTRQLGYGSVWFGVNEAIKDLITPEWVKIWRQGRVKYGYISKKMSKKKKDEIYTTTWSNEEVQKRKILYPESLPEKKQKKKD